MAAKAMSNIIVAFGLLVAMAAAFDVRDFIPNNLLINDDLVWKSGEKAAGSCQKQLQKQQLDCCQVYLRESSKASPPSLAMAAADQAAASTWRDAFPRCCDQLEQITKQCRCEAIKQVVQLQMQVGQLQGAEMREMLQNAQSLPVLCRIKKAQACNIPTGPTVPTPMGSF